ncbi:MBL fold metallo-hydrolase [Microbacterium sp. A204]|uniref:MBL fold metallo-hydrolase n=1 Tax=Microbacterium sp. A204 TaxID=3457321 RepID=UPI003FCF9738
MSNPVKVHPIVSPWGRFGLYSFFIDAPEPAIIDTGIAVSPRDGIAPALEDLGRNLEDVRWILVTHGHPDHVGGAVAAWETTGRRAQVAIHEADAGLLRRRSAHVDSYVQTRERYLNDPDGVAKQQAMAAEVISGEMEPSIELHGGETLSLGGDVTISVHHTPGHTPGSVTYVLDQQNAAFVGDAVQVNGAANGFPGYEDPTAYRRSLQYLHDEVQPARVYLGHHFRNPVGHPYGIELHGADGLGAIRTSLDVEERIADRARAQFQRGLSREDSAYDPFALVAADMAYAADPTLEPSPFFTTLNGYRNEFERAAS